MCRSRRELSKKGLIAKFGIDKAENELSEVWPDCLPRGPPPSPLLGQINSYIALLRVEEAAREDAVHVDAAAML